jgi:hypothetical protein
MDGICSTHAVDEQSTEDFSCKARREETLRDLVVNAKIILKWMAGFNSFRIGTNGGLL